MTLINRKDATTKLLLNDTFLKSVKKGNKDKYIDFLQETMGWAPMASLSPAEVRGPYHPIVHAVPPLKMGGEQGLCFCGHALCRNIQYEAASLGQHAKRIMAGPPAAPHANRAEPKLAAVQGASVS